MDLQPEPVTYICGDGMEEDALNEQAHRQVIKDMLSDAETEVQKLEKETGVMLISQLHRADEVWFKKHIALTEMSNSLIALIQTLRYEGRIEGLPQFHLQRLGERAENQSALLTALLESESSNTGGQLCLHIETLAIFEGKCEVVCTIYCLFATLGHSIVSLVLWVIHPLLLKYGNVAVTDHLMSMKVLEVVWNHSADLERFVLRNCNWI